MRKLTLLLLTIGLIFTACNDYDDTDLRKEIEALANQLIALQQQCEKTNQEIAVLHALMETYKDKDFLTTVTPIEKEGEEIGYEFVFEKSGKITIYKGSGEIESPIISIKQDNDTNWYWTIRIGNEEPAWITDEQGNKVIAMPSLKIENEHWFLSIDGGKTWNNIGQATGNKGEAGDSIFKDIIIDDENKNITVILKDGNNFSVSLNTFNITFSEITDILLMQNETIEVSYSITGGNEDIQVRVINTNNINASVIPHDHQSGIIQIENAYFYYEEQPEVIIIATDNKERSLFRILSFKEGIIDVVNDLIEIDATGGTKELKINYNVPYSLEIQNDAQAWISISPAVRSLQTDHVRIDIQSNSGYGRTGNIKLKNRSGKYYHNIIVYQQGNENGKSVHVERAGTLEHYFSNDEINTVEVLFLTGELNANDFEFLSSKMGNLKSLDLFSIDNREMPYAAFAENRSIHTIVFPYNMPVIPDEIFSNSAIEIIIFSPQTHVITPRAFYNCSNIQQITIPEYVNEIEAGAFDNCINLEEIIFKERKNNYDELLRIQGEAFKGCTKLKKLNIPYFLSSIGPNAFRNCNTLEEIKFIPDQDGYTHLTYIEEGAFAECISLKEIEIPAQVREIAKETFFNCTALKKITFAKDSQLNKIGLSNLVFGDKGTFQNCTSLTTIHLPASLTYIGSETFYECKNLHRVTFENGSQLKLIGDIYESYEEIHGAFENTGLTSITLPANTSQIKTRTFAGCKNLKEFICESNSNLEAIGAQAFFESGLESFICPTKLMYIPRDAFANCKQLKTFTIPVKSSLQLIQEQAFYNSHNLNEFIIHSERLIELGGNPFNGFNKTPQLFVPIGYKTIYESNGWNKWFTITEHSN